MARNVKVFPNNPKLGLSGCHWNGMESSIAKSGRRTVRLAIRVSVTFVCKNVKVMSEQGAPTTNERILEATLEVLARSGPRKLSLSDVAAAAGVSRPTLYRWFPSKEALLDAFGRYEQHKYDAGIAAAIVGLEGEARLDAVLRHIVDFQYSYSLRRVVDVEPEHVVQQMTRVLPIMRDRLLPLFPGRDGRTTASVVTRV